MGSINSDVSARMSHRLRSIADMLGASCAGKKDERPIVADIGCDHGYVSIYLVQSGAAKGAVAMDVRKGPLQGAADNISEYGLSDKIVTRLSDGFAELKKGEAEAAIIAGMGGKLMMRILEDGDPVALGIKEAVLQPQSDFDEFREYLRNKGYTIAEENVIFDEGKYYFPMRVIFGRGEDHLEKAVELLVAKTGCSDDTARSICNRFGEHNILKKDALLKEYLEHGREVSESILQNLEKAGHEKRYEELTKELEEIKLLLKLFE